MSSVLHIENLNDDTYRQLEKDATAHGLSPAERAAQVLASHYPPQEEGAPRIDKSTALRRIFGTWDEHQVREFNEATADFEKIDEEMWK